MLKVYNTLTKQIDNFKPIHAGEVKMYNCGPTVYFYPQIGNWRAYIFVDTLKRILLQDGYKVTQLMNITDVGHLTSDADEGEDKLEKGAKREHKTVWEVAQFYIDDFIQSRETLHILPPTDLWRATDHIPEQIDMIKKLIAHGHAYVTEHAVYFEIKTFPTYADFSGQKQEEKEVGVRDELVIDKNKRDPHDFVLWVLDRPDHQMLWDSPWGKGFPGWHIECSAMSTTYLGQPFDIHTGGIDHLPIHHPNEIAQAEGANRVRFVNYWLHNAFLTINGRRMGKSLGNAFTLQDIKDFLKEHLGFASVYAPIALRYLYLTAHYRHQLDFTKESLYAAFKTLSDIYVAFAGLKDAWDGYVDTLSEKQKNDIDIWLHGFNTTELMQGFRKEILHSSYLTELHNAMERDLDTPSILASMHQLLGDTSLELVDKFVLLIEFDKVLGLGLYENMTTYIHTYTDEQRVIIQEREIARAKGDYTGSDQLRDKLERMGISVMDQKDKTLYYRK